jgi:hypothetical protein
MGNPPTAVGKDRSFAYNLKNMTVALGHVLRERLSLLVNLDACVLHFQNQNLSHANITPHEEKCLND